jgi:hypothetical protein
MIYRPQFVYPLAPGEREFDYFFSVANVPALGLTTLGPGASINDIPLQLQPGVATFRARALKISTGFRFSFKLSDAFGTALSDDLLVNPLAYQPSNYGVLRVGTPTVIFEPEIVFGPGGLFFLSVGNPNAVPNRIQSVQLLFRGVQVQHG